MTHSQNILTATFDRLSDQFAQAASSDIQTSLQLAVGNWHRFSAGGSGSVGVLSSLASVRSLPTIDDRQTTASEPRFDRVGDNRLLTALQDQLATLHGHASIPAAMRRPNRATSDAASLARSSSIGANAISQSLSHPSSAEAAGTGELLLPGSSLGAPGRDPLSLQIPNETAQRISQSANRLLADHSTAGFASAPQSPSPAVPPVGGRLEAAVAHAQPAPPDSRGSAVDAISSRTLDRLRHAALRQMDPGEDLVPFQSGPAARASHQPLPDRTAQTARLADRDRTDGSVSWPGSGDSDAINAQPTPVHPLAASPQLPAPAAAHDPHQSAWATIQSLKADARWNNQPTDVLKPLW